MCCAEVSTRGLGTFLAVRLGGSGGGLRLLRVLCGMFVLQVLCLFSDE